MKDELLFKERLKTILRQLSSDQADELFESILKDDRFSYLDSCPSFEDLKPKEVRFLHDQFIVIQYSDDHRLQGEDIRGVLIYPYKSD